MTDILTPRFFTVCSDTKEINDDDEPDVVIAVSHRAAYFIIQESNLGRNGGNESRFGRR
jgi:hypothetical protein